MIDPELFSPFCSTFDSRSWTKTPFRQFGYVVATDASIMVAVRQENVKGYEDMPEYYGFNCVKIIENLGNMERLSVADVEESLECLYLEDELREEGEACKECSGSGQVNWEYLSPSGRKYFLEAECPVCDGDGGKKMVKTGRKVPRNFSALSIKGRFFKHKYLRKVLDMFASMGVLSFDYCVDGDMLRMRTDDRIYVALMKYSNPDDVAFLKIKTKY